MGKKGRGNKKKSSKKRQKKSSRGQGKLGGRFTELAIVAMLLLAVYFAIFGGEYTVFELNRLEAIELERAAQLARAQTEIDSLRQVASQLKNDAAEIERVARERYGMIREGEILYRFLEAPDQNAAGLEEPPGK